MTQKNLYLTATFTLTVLIVTAIWHNDVSAGDLSHQQLQQHLQKMLQQRDNTLTLNRVKPAPIKGMVQMQINNGPMLYATENGQYFLVGNLYKVTDEGIVDALNDERKEFLNNASRDEVIRFSPSGEVKGILNVFTDITCGYCRQLHRDMDQLNALGIEVRYFAFPRAGIDSPSYHQMVSAWCGNNRQQLLTQLKNGQNIKKSTCEHPIDKHFNAGNRLGVNGTPAIVLSDGQLIFGYRPPAGYAQLLSIKP